MKTLIEYYNGQSVAKAVSMPKDKLILALTIYDTQHDLESSDYESKTEDELRNEYLTKIFQFNF